MELSSLIVLLAAFVFKTWASKAYDKHLKPKLFLWEEKYAAARVKREATLILTIPVILYVVTTVADRFFGGDLSYWTKTVTVYSVYFFYLFYYDSLANPREDERPLIVRVRFVRQVLVASKLIWFVTFILILYGTVGYVSVANNFSVNDVSFRYANPAMSPTGLLQEQQRYPSYRICGYNGISSCFLCRLFHNFPVPVVMAGLFYVAHLTHFVFLSMGAEILNFGWREVSVDRRDDEGEETHFMVTRKVSEEEDERNNGLLWRMSLEMRKRRAYKGNNAVVGAQQSRRRSAGEGAVVVQ